MFDAIDLIGEVLIVEGIKCKLNEFNGKKTLKLIDPVYNQYIEVVGNENVIRVFLWGKKKGDEYTKEEQKSCMDRRADLVNSLNLKNLGYQFVTMATPKSGGVL